jgi:hypothetical protein
MPAALQTYFEWPMLPFSLLLCVATVYWLLVILGGIGLEFLDFDLDVSPDPGGDGSIFDWGMIGLKWFNLGEVPLMVWLTAFVAPAWLMSATFDRELIDPTTREIVMAVLRNCGVGLLAAKVVTQPLRGVFTVREPNTVREMMGRTCEVTTVEANASFGQARCRQDGAPLVLNIRTTGETLSQGTVVEIVDYSPEARTYIVRSAAPECAAESRVNAKA